MVFTSQNCRECKPVRRFMEPKKDEYEVTVTIWKQTVTTTSPGTVATYPDDYTSLGTIRGTVQHTGAMEVDFAARQDERINCVLKMPIDNLSKQLLADMKLSFVDRMGTSVVDIIGHYPVEQQTRLRINGAIRGKASWQ